MMFLYIIFGASTLRNRLLLYNHTFMTFMTVNSKKLRWAKEYAVSVILRRILVIFQNKVETLARAKMLGSSSIRFDYVGSGNNDRDCNFEYLKLLP